MYHHNPDSVVNNLKTSSYGYSSAAWEGAEERFPSAFIVIKYGRCLQMPCFCYLYNIESPEALFMLINFQTMVTYFLTAINSLLKPLDSFIR